MAALPNPERRSHGTQQSLLAERLQQTIDRAVLKNPVAAVLVAVRRDEDDRNLRLPKHQLSLEVWSAHAWHGDVQDQATHPLNTIRREESLGGGECLNGPTERP